jgi:hypothetical protein
MKTALIVLLSLAAISCTKSQASDKGYDEFDTAYMHCVKVEGGYNGNSPALSCIPKEAK